MICLPDDPTDVPRELDVGDAQVAGLPLVDCLHWPACIEIGGDIREVGDERDATNSLDTFGRRRRAHPSLRRVQGRAAQGIRLV